MRKQVNVSIKNGKVKTDFQNFQGNQCKILGDKLRGEGFEEETMENKPEFYRDDFNVNTEKDSY
ncbi:MAG: hypothetical protein EOO52_12925 [Gammaproteobacteria bacterium]|nr:MAG: hypothetical protein EOO52_12925 [Gammaproteobacteria bacterium]